jgi:hypothetical protein
MSTDTFIMILYHGTSTKYLPSILAEGLQPRSITGRKSHFAGDVASKPDLVYLTDCYAMYYAFVAAHRDDADLAILKVDVSNENLFPDEDFVAYVLSIQNKTSWKKTIATTDPRDFQHHWQESLAYSGVAAIASVVPLAILDHRIFDRVEHCMLALATGADASPNFMNHQVCGLGAFYRTCLETLFSIEVEKVADAVSQLREDFDRERYGDEFVNWRKSTINDQGS